MAPAVKTRIVRIGNSRGVRIPKTLLELTELQEEVELEVREGEIIVRAARPIRPGWEEAFKDMGSRHDELLDDGAPYTTARDEEEWEW